VSASRSSPACQVPPPPLKRASFNSTRADHMPRLSRRWCTAG
jgi:hypothetical protein